MLLLLQFHPCISPYSATTLPWPTDILGCCYLSQLWLGEDNIHIPVPHGAFLAFSRNCQHYSLKIVCGRATNCQLHWHLLVTQMCSQLPSWCPPTLGFDWFLNCSTNSVALMINKKTEKAPASFALNAFFSFELTIFYMLLLLLRSFYFTYVS